MTLIVLLALAVSTPNFGDEFGIKTPTRTFTKSHLIALDKGLIWWKPNPASGTDGPWSLFPPRGVPIGKNAAWPAPQYVDSISADGDNLIAVGNDGHVYYVKLDTQEWQPKWGPKFRDGPLILDLGAGEKYAISHRKQPFQDLDGNPHPIIVGVTTLFISTRGGLELQYTDPWLPPGKRHHICLPEHGQFRVAAMSASASTVFVMDAAGRMFTRLNDFDSLGLDPVIRYGWNRQRRTTFLDDEVYSLPAHPWLQQPTVPGPTIVDITVLQTGEGNNQRELRVASPDGYWKKMIDAEKWEHVTAPPIPDDRVDTRALMARVAVHTRTLRGTYEGQPVTVEDWAADCPPATLVLGDARLPLEFLEDWEPKTRVLYGALYDDGHHLPLFHGRELIEVRLELDGDRVTLVEQFRPSALKLQLELKADPLPPPPAAPKPEPTPPSLFLPPAQREPKPVEPDSARP